MAGKKILRNTTVNERVYNKEYVDYLESLVVKLSGNQTIAGIKTFGQSPIVPTPTELTQIANKGYADSIIGNQAFPDYARRSLITDIDPVPAPNDGNYYKATWTATQNGYVFCALNATTNMLANVVYWGYRVDVNNVAVFSYQKTVQQNGYPIKSTMIAVKAGDVVTFRIANISNTTPMRFSSHFIPIAPQNNFNIYPDYSNGVVSNIITLNFPSDGTTPRTLFTADKDGTYFILSTDFPPRTGRIKFHVNGFDVSMFQQSDTYANVLLPLKKGDIVTIIVSSALGGNIGFRYTWFPQAVSVNNVKDNWINVPLTRMNTFTKGTAVLKYNSSLGAFRLKLAGAGVTTQQNGQTNVLSFTNPTNITQAVEYFDMFYKYNSSNTTSNPPQLLGITLNANATSYVSIEGSQLETIYGLFGVKTHFIEQ